MKRAIALSSCLLVACATAPAPTPDAPASAPPAAAPPQALPTPTCPTAAPSANEGDAAALFGQPIARVCTLGAGDDERLKLQESVAPREGETLTAELVAADLQGLARTGFIRTAEAIAQPVAGGGVVLTYVVTQYPQLGKTEFVGADHTDVNVLRDLALKSAWASPYVLARLARTITEHYQELGYARVKVEPKLGALTDGKADATFAITEGPRTTISAIRFVGNKRLKEADLKKGLRSTVKAPWQEALGTLDELQLAAAYYDRGMVNARVTATHADGQNPGDVEVTFTISEGDVFTLGVLSLSGHKLGDDKDVLKAFESKSGLVFSRAMLQRDMQRLRTRGARQGVSVDVTPITNVDLEKKRIDVKLEVEKQTGGSVTF